MSKRLYEFSWASIGNIQAGRPNLGHSMSTTIYRLFQYTLRDILEQDFGTEESDKIFYKAGYLGGKSLCLQFIDKYDDLSEYFIKVQEIFQELGIGILRMEKAEMNNLTFTLTVAEDLDCSGLADIGHAVCSYDEGFIAGIFDSFSDTKFEVKEIGCWCSGDRTCRFEIKPNEVPA